MVLQSLLFKTLNNGDRTYIFFPKMPADISGGPKHKKSGFFAFLAIF